MEVVRSWDQYERAISSVRRVAGTYTTNMYGQKSQIERWCASGSLGVITVDGAVLMLRMDRDFVRVYHVAEDRRALASALEALPSGTYVADIVGKGSALENVCESYVAQGFETHRSLQRMCRGKADAPISNSSLVASAGDATLTHAFLERLLDPLTEQIPEIAELEREAQAGHLLLVRRGNSIIGMLLYDLHGATGHLRFWHVDDTARGEGVGRQLMAGFLDRCSKAQRLLLWVLGDNERSIAIYRHYGFVADGLLDRIMIKHKEYP